MVGIGFFAPFPLALMIPFMAGQSLAMGEAFGKGFQYGKRKISSMSNKDFNELTFEKLSQSLTTDYKSMIPNIQESIRASDKLQSAVFQELGDLIKSIPVEILNFFDSATRQTSGITQTAFTGSVGIPLGPKAGSPEDQFGVVSELARKAAEAVLPGSLGGTTRTKTTKTIPRVTTQFVTKEIQRGANETNEILRNPTKFVGNIGTKRPAGQSQKAEQRKLTSGIIVASKAIAKLQKALAASNRNDRSAVFNIMGTNMNGSAIRTAMLRTAKTMTALQKALTLLLTRYKF